MTAPSHLFSASAAIILSKSLCELFPLLHLARAGVTSHGFFCEFLTPQPLDTQIFVLIEEKMRALVKADQPLYAAEMLCSNAVELFRHHKRLKYVERLLESEGLVELGRIENYWEIISGPFLESTGQIEAFKLLTLESLATDDAKQKGFRIVGVAFGSKQELKGYLKIWSELKDLNIPQLSIQKKLWRPEDLAAGAVWLPYGIALQQQLLAPWRAFCGAWNIPIVQALETVATITPLMLNVAELTFHANPESQDYVPLMHPEWCLSDLMLIERSDNSQDLIAAFLKLQHQVYTKLKLPFVFKGSPKPFWKKTAAQAEVDLLSDDSITNGIAMVIRDRLGAEWRAGSILAGPRRIDLSFYGGLERLLCLLFEHWKGNVPLEFAPEQIRLFPIGQEAEEVVREFAQELSQEGVRVAIDRTQGDLKARMRALDWTQPALVGVVGPKEAADKTITLRLPKGKEERVTMQSVRERLINSFSDSLKVFFA